MISEEEIGQSSFVCVCMAGVKQNWRLEIKNKSVLKHRFICILAENIEHGTDQIPSGGLYQRWVKDSLKSGELCGDAV